MNNAFKNRLGILTFRSVGLHYKRQVLLIRTNRKDKESYQSCSFTVGDEDYVTKRQNF